MTAKWGALITGLMGSIPNRVEGSEVFESWSDRTLAHFDLLKETLPIASGNDREPPEGGT